jgi:hypothetical protein
LLGRLVLEIKDPDVEIAVAIRLKSDFGAVRGPVGLRDIREVVGQSMRGAAGRVDHPEGRDKVEGDAAAVA